MQTTVNFIYSFCTILCSNDWRKRGCYNLDAVHRRAKEEDRGPLADQTEWHEGVHSRFRSRWSSNRLPSVWKSVWMPSINGRSLEREWVLIIETFRKRIFKLENLKESWRLPINDKTWKRLSDWQWGSRSEHLLRSAQWIASLFCITKLARTGLLQNNSRLELGKLTSPFWWAKL